MMVIETCLHGLGEFYLWKSGCIYEDHEGRAGGTGTGAVHMGHGTCFGLLRRIDIPHSVRRFSEESDRATVDGMAAFGSASERLQQLYILILCQAAHLRPRTSGTESGRNNPSHQTPLLLLPRDVSQQTGSSLPRPVLDSSKRVSRLYDICILPIRLTLFVESLRLRHHLSQLRTG